jgi:hypothetical protein
MISTTNEEEDGDVITLSNSIVEQKSGETSTPNSISLVEDQTLDGQHITTITPLEKDGGKVTRIPCNIPYVQIFELTSFPSRFVIDGLVNIVSWTVMPKFVGFDLNSIELGSGQMDEIDGVHWEALSTPCLEANQEVVMASHPSPLLSPFLKRIPTLFVLMPYIL